MTYTVDGDGRYTIDGRTYTGHRLKEIQSDHTGTIWVFDWSEIVDKCDCCGRFGTRPATANSLQDAVNRGYLTEVTG